MNIHEAAMYTKSTGEKANRGEKKAYWGVSATGGGPVGLRWCDTGSRVQVTEWVLEGWGKAESTWQTCDTDEATRKLQAGFRVQTSRRGERWFDCRLEDGILCFDYSGHPVYILTDRQWRFET